MAGQFGGVFGVGQEEFDGFFGEDAVLRALGEEDVAGLEDELKIVGGGFGTGGRLHAGRIEAGGDGGWAEMVVGELTECDEQVNARGGFADFLMVGHGLFTQLIHGAEQGDATAGLRGLESDEGGQGGFGTGIIGIVDDDGAVNAS